MTAPVLSIPREAGVSFGINAMLSLAFFVAGFGITARPLAWGAPDALGRDFVPQSIAVSLMSALVPALLARKRQGLIIQGRTIVFYALGLAVAGAAVGEALAVWVANADLAPIGWSHALAMKLFYGGSLGAIVTSLMLWKISR